jgi:hypothetical protein
MSVKNEVIGGVIWAVLVVTVSTLFLLINPVPEAIVMHIGPVQPFTANKAAATILDEKYSGHWQRKVTIQEEPGASSSPAIVGKKSQIHSRAWTEIDLCNMRHFEDTSSDFCLELNSEEARKNSFIATLEHTAEERLNQAVQEIDTPKYLQ